MLMIYSHSIVLLTQYLLYGIVVTKTSRKPTQILQQFPPKTPSSRLSRPWVGYGQLFFLKLSGYHVVS